MIVEVAILNVKPGLREAFEAAFAAAEPIMLAARGHLSHQLLHCLETPDRYILIVQWETLEAHTLGFRGGSQYAEWKRLLHHFYEPYPPLVEHYEVTH
jgi:heme-degrading monooxygenase HmoA